MTISYNETGPVQDVQDVQNQLSALDQRMKELESQLRMKDDSEKQLQERVQQLNEQLQKQQAATVAADNITASHNGQNHPVTTTSVTEIEERQQPWHSFPTCCRCHQLTSELKLFPCIHGCCSACLDQLRQATATTATEETDVVNCPECQQCASSDLSDSPANRYVVKLMNSIASHNDGFTTSRCSWRKHETSDGDQVIQYCYQCRKGLCSDCVAEHSRVWFDTSHCLVPIEDRLPLEADTSCKDHNGQQISVYCVSCQKMGCLRCLGSHREHIDSCQVITDLAEECRNELIEDVERLRVEINGYEDRLHRLDDNKNESKDTVDELKRAIQNQYEHMLNCINFTRDSLNRRVETFDEQTIRHLELIELATKRQLEITRSVEQFSEKVLKSGKDCQIDLVCFCMNLSKEAWTWPKEVLQMTLPKKIIFRPIDFTNLVPDDERCLIGELLEEGQQAERLETYNEMKTQLEKVTQECLKLDELKSRLEQNVLELTESIEKYAEKLEEKIKIISELEETNVLSRQRIQEDEQKLNELIEQNTQAQSRISGLEREVASLQMMKDDLEVQKTSVENNLKTVKTELTDLRELARNEKEESNARLIELGDCKDQLELLKSENERLQLDVQQAASRERHLESCLNQMEMLRSMNDRLHLDIEHAADRERCLKARLDQLLYERVPPKLVLVGRIPDTNVRCLAPVYGLVTLNGKLYALRMGSRCLEIYDSDTFLLLSKVSLNGITDAIDMTSCVTHRCIYIADGRNNTVHSIELTESSTDVDCSVRKKWATGVHEPRGLSVTPIECHLLVACATEPNQLVILKADGQQLKTIPLDIGGGIRHSILLPCGQLLVCFTAASADIGGVCHVTQDGVVRRKITVGTPYHLAIDSVYNDVYVANFEGRKVILLHRDLADMSEPMENDDESKESQTVKKPLRLCLDHINRRLYVAESGGRISVYAVNEKRPMVDV